MSSDLIAKASITLDASIDKVWEALTNPALIARYLFGTETVTDWKAGSPIIFKGTWEGKSYEDKGVILEIEKGKVLKYSYWSSMAGTKDSPENYANVTCRLARLGNTTELVITQDNCKTVESRDHSARNWNTVLESFATVVQN